MERPMTPSHLRSDLFRVLDRILETGESVEVRRKGARLRISPIIEGRDLSLLKPHPDSIAGNPDEIAGMDWSGEWTDDLP